MSKTEFNKLFDRVRKYGSVKFKDHGDDLVLSLFNGQFCLEVQNGNVLNTVYTHWCQACFLPILTDVRR